MTITVIAVLGYGRSGSTLLDALLGQHPNVAGVGELVQLHREGWQLNNYCACGARARDCSFWAEVRRLWIARSGMASIEEYLGLQRRFLRPSTLLSGAKAWETDEAARFLRATQAIYEGVSEVSGNNTIVDSSKLPLGADQTALQPASLAARLSARSLHAHSSVDRHLHTGLPQESSLRLLA